MNEINLLTTVLIVHCLECKFHILRIEYWTEENLKLSSESVNPAFFRSTFEVSWAYLELLRLWLVFSGQGSDKLFKLLFKVVRPLASFAFNIICRFIEEDDVVSPDLTENSFENNICSLIRFKANFEVFELIRVGNGLLQFNGWCIYL